MRDIASVLTRMDRGGWVERIPALSPEMDCSHLAGDAFAKCGVKAASAMALVIQAFVRAGVEVAAEMPGRGGAHALFTLTPAGLGRTNGEKAEVRFDSCRRVKSLLTLSFRETGKCGTAARPAGHTHYDRRWRQRLTNPALLVANRVGLLATSRSPDRYAQTQMAAPPASALCGGSQR